MQGVSAAGVGPAGACAERAGSAHRGNRGKDVATHLATAVTSAATHCVRDLNAASAPALDSYVAAFRAGGSILVRPKAEFPGLTQVIESVGRLAVGSVLVTDLEGPPHEQPAASGTSDESVFAYHTSGSTGSPKCVIYRRAQVISHAQAVIDALGLGEEHAYAALPPMRFAYGLSIVTSHLLAEVPVTFIDAEWGLPGLESVTATDERPLAVYALPQHTPLLIASSLPAHRLARLFIAGGRLSGASAAALARRFPAMRLTNMYGQAEMGPRLAIWEGDPATFVEGTIGRPIRGVHLEIATGTSDSPATGDLLARSDHAMSYCLRAPYTDLEEFAGRVGLVRTGDLGTALPDGTLRHDGRADHILNVAGTKVDVRRLMSIVQDVAHPLLLNVGSRPTRVAGDVVPVVELVPDGPTPSSTIAIRRALGAEFGSLAALFDIRYVDRLSLKESGK